MNYLQRLEYWGNTHHPKYLDLLRIAFGIFLCIKGIQFASNSILLNETLGSNVPFNTLLLVLLGHYIIFAHVLGGFLIAVGMLTRLACLIQIPILLGAVIFVNADMVNHFPAFLESIIVLGLLIYFLIIGSGTWSLDHIMSKEKTE